MKIQIDIQNSYLALLGRFFKQNRLVPGKKSYRGSPRHSSKKRQLRSSSSPATLQEGNQCRIGSREHRLSKMARRACWASTRCDGRKRETTVHIEGVRILAFSPWKQSRKPCVEPRPGEAPILRSVHQAVHVVEICTNDSKCSVVFTERAAIGAHF